MFYLIAMAQPTGAAGAHGGSMFGSLLPLILIFVIFYFLLIRPQTKKQKEHQRMLSQIKKGDKVITSGGIHGIISAVKDNIVSIKIAENVKIDVSKGNISIVQKEAQEKA